MNKFIDNIKKKVREASMKGTNMVLIDAQELLDLKARAIAKAETKPLTSAQLTMLQLGSYIPNFEALAAKPDDFKNRLGRLCRELMLSEEWQYLITHLKQDQVNNAFFVEGVTVTDPFVRGSINGVYVVDEQIGILGRNYDQRLKEGNLVEKPTKKK